MVWGAITRFEKYPLIIMPATTGSVHNFVEIIHEGTLSGFYFLYDCSEDLILMEDGTPVHYVLLPNQ